MIILATNEIYTLGVKVGITGDKETINKLDAIGRMAEQTKMKMEALNKINASPTVKLNDEASSKLEALEAKINKVKNSNADVKVGAKDETSGAISKIGEKINGLVKAGAQKVISFGVGGIESSLKNYTDYEKTLSNVKVIANATDSEMKRMDATAKKLGSSTNWSAISVAEAEKTLVQSGISVKDTVSALPGILNLATAGGIDLAAAADIASGTLTGFNLKGSDSAHVADVLASSASETKSDLGELGDTMKYMAPVSSSLGISLEDTAVATGLLSGQNIKGSQAAAMLRQTIGKLAGPTKEASEMIKKYHINAYDAECKLKPLSGVVDSLNSSLGNLPDQEKEGAIATIFGADNMSGILALMNQGGKSFDELSKKVQNAKGLAKEMADTKTDNLAGQWDRLKASATTMSVTLGEKLAPYAKQFVDWLIEKMPVIEDKIVGIVDYVSNNIGEVKALADTVIVLGSGLVVLSAAGKVSNAFKGITSLVGILKGASVVAETTAIAGGLGEVGVMGGLLPAIFSPVGFAVIGTVAAMYTLNEATEMLNSSCTKSKEDTGLMQRGLAKLYGQTVYSKKEMEQMGIIYEDWNNTISQNTQKELENTASAISNLGFQIDHFTGVSNVIKKADAADLTKQVNDLSSDVISTIRANSGETNKSVSEMFKLDGSTLDNNELAVMSFLNGSGDKQIKAVEEKQKKINSIIEEATKKNRGLYANEQTEIDKLLKDIGTAKFDNTVKNNNENIDAQAEFNVRSKNLDQSSLSKLLQEKAKTRDDNKKSISEQYDIPIEKIQLQMNNMNTPQRIAAQQVIDEKTKERDKALAIEDEKYKGYIDTAKSRYSKLMTTIDSHEGTKLNRSQQMDKEKINDYQKTYSELSKVNESGTYQVYDEGTNNFKNMYVDFDKSTGEITSLWSTTQGIIAGQPLLTQVDMEKILENENKMRELEGTWSEVKNNIEGRPISGKISFRRDKYGVLIPVDDSSDNDGKETTAEKVKNNDKGSESANDLLKSSIMYKGSKSSEDDFHLTKFDSFNLTSKKENYTGTNNGTRGINSVAERGFEIVMGKEYRWFNGGEKVLNHKKSKEFLANQLNNEPFQVKQGQYQVFQPQMQVAGAGGVSVGDIQVSVNGNHDANGIVQEVVQVVGYKLKEALTNIKK